MLTVLVALSSARRVYGHANYGHTHTYIADFGFLAGGSFNLTWTTENPDVRLGVRLYIFTSLQYSSWFSTFMHGSLRSCPALPSESVDSWTIVLDGDVKSAHFPIEEDGVYFFIIVNCNESRNVEYYVDARFVNPDGQHLDARDVPTISILYGDFGAFSLLGVGFLVWLLVKHFSGERTGRCRFGCHGFLPIHVILIVLPLLYVVSCVFKQFALRRAAVSDEASEWSVALAALSFIYETTLFSTLLVASTGWCLINTDTSAKEVALSIASVAVFTGSCLAQKKARSSTTVFAIMVVQDLAVLLILFMLRRNSKKAKRLVKAHLLVIRNQGIDPTTTPVYEKLRFYSTYIYVSSIAVGGFLVMNMFFSLVTTSNWLVSLVTDIVHLAIIAALMVMYRPRGGVLDLYMRRDTEAGEGRPEVRLEDIDNYEVGEGGVENMRGWEEGMQLPVQPIIVSSEEPQASEMVPPRRDPTYVAVEEPLNP